MLCVSHVTHDDRKEKAEKLYLEFIIAQAIFICFWWAAPDNTSEETMRNTFLK
jgi:hypothetical protein